MAINIPRDICLELPWILLGTHLLSLYYTIVVLAYQPHPHSDPSSSGLHLDDVSIIHFTHHTYSILLHARTHARTHTHTHTHTHTVLHVYNHLNIVYSNLMLLFNLVQYHLMLYKISTLTSTDVSQPPMLSDTQLIQITFRITL